MSECMHLGLSSMQGIAVSVMLLLSSWLLLGRQVLADVPPTATCPKCRQRYVFREVLELKELGAVIRMRYVTPCSSLVSCCPPNGSLFSYPEVY